jgi:hypothetical protein
MGYPAPRPAKTARSRIPAPVGLRLQEPPERLSALLREHDRLLKKIDRKKKDLEGLVQRVQAAGVALAGAQPLIALREGLDREIHAIFDHLLARKRQPRGFRRLVVALYEMLQHTGVLSFRDRGDDQGDDAPEFFDGFDADGGPFGGGPGAGGVPHRDGESPSARRPGDAPEDQSLRGLFRRLATALHPDKVHDEDEKARRTEVMKEISRAYEDRDLARLLKLERTWLAGGGLGHTGDDRTSDDHTPDEIDRRCAHIQRTNAGLHTQLKIVVQELKDLRRSPPALILKDLKRATERGEDPIAELIAGANAEVARARELRDFAVSFRDGRITLDEFIRGPASARAGDGAGDGDPRADDDGDGDGVSGEEEAYNAVMELLFGDAIPVAAPRRGKRSRRSKRDVRSGDVPF